MSLQKETGHTPLEGHNLLVGAVDEVYALARLVPVQLNSDYKSGVSSWRNWGAWQKLACRFAGWAY